MSFVSRYARRGGMVYCVYFGGCDLERLSLSLFLSPNCCDGIVSMFDEEVSDDAGVGVFG